MIKHTNFVVEPWAVRETSLDLEALAQAESVFALSNGHSGCVRTWTKASRSALPGHVSELVLRAAAAALRGSRLRLPGVGPDDRERDEREDHPPARRRRAAGRALRAAARARARARPPRGRATAPHGVAVAGRHRGASVLDAARLLRAAIRGRDPLRGRAARGTAARGRAVRVSWRTSPRLPAPPIHAPLPRSSRRCSPDESFDHDVRACSSHATRNSKLGLAAGMDHVVDGPSRDGHRGGEPRRTSHA